MNVKLLAGVLFFAIGCTGFICAQDNVDSLVNRIDFTTADTSKFNLFLKIGDALEYQHPDSAMIYYKKALRIAMDIEDKKRMANASYCIGIIHDNKGDFNQALEQFQNSIRLYERIEEDYGVARVLNNMGIVYSRQGAFEKAIEAFLQSAKVFEKLGRQRNISRSYNNIGAIFYNQGSFDQAIEYFQKSLKIKQEMGDHQGTSSSYNNIGMIYYEQGKYNKTIEYFKKSLTIEREFGNKKGVAESYNNIGEVHLVQGNYDRAFEFYLKSIELKNAIGDKNGLAEGYLNLSALHTQLADSITKDAIERKYYLQQAVKYGNKALSIARQIKALPAENSIAEALMETFGKQGLADSALQYAKLYIATRDSLFNREKTEALAEMQTKYKSEQKQQEIEKQKIQIARKNAVMKKQELQRNGLIAVIVLFALIAIIIFRNFKQKQKANALIQLKNERLEHANAEITNQKEEIEAQRDEIETQRDKVTDQKQEIESIHHKLVSSIDYALLIQQAVLPSREQLTDILGEHFVLYKPHSVVSGDFYWAAKAGQDVIFCVADCTGHGVPGAFMSMLGISFLDEIVRKNGVTQPDRILNELRVLVVEALKQKNVEDKMSLSVKNTVVKDGMDVAICVYNTENGVLQYAGAGNPFYLVRSSGAAEVNHKRKLTANGYTLYEIKGDAMPIGIYKKMDPFTAQTIQLNKGDSVYLFSDGFADQFSGKSVKKFTFPAFKNQILQNVELPMPDQKIKLEQTFENWKGNHEQIDDVCVLGVKVN